VKSGFPGEGFVDTAFQRRDCSGWFVSGENRWSKA
jgi:hypothetical protein